MLEQLKYRNHLGEDINFGKAGIYVDKNELHNYEWDVKKKNNRITALSHAVRKRKLPVWVVCQTDADATAAKNRLMEVAEKDVLAMEYGKLFIGDYYYRCFVTKSVKRDYLKTQKMMRLELTLTTDLPYWVKESRTVFRSQEVSGGGIDYPIAYPYDYLQASAGDALNNSSFMPSNFRMIIYGPCSNPAVTVGGHLYQVNCTVGDNEYLTIDSVSKKIYLTANDGTVTNKFNDRNRASYIFAKLPTGRSTVAWAGSYGVDIVLLEERSEPKWI